MRRRKFLVLSILISFGKFTLARPVASKTCTTCSVDLEAIQNKISRLFFDVRGARSVGQRFLALNPDQAHLPLLLEGVGITGRDPASFTTKDIDHLIRKDFLLGHTVLLDGWVLARSELNLYAILALS